MFVISSHKAKCQSSEVMFIIMVLNSQAQKFWLRSDKYVIEVRTHTGTNLTAVLLLWEERFLICSRWVNIWIADARRM